MTDGTHLFRAVSAIGGAAGLVWLEDCQSPEVFATPAEQVRRLREVSPRGTAVSRNYT